MLDYTALATLTQVIRLGSFEAAAHALNLTPSAVSQRIRTLEDRVGAVLIHRGPPATGTPTGLRLMQHLEQVRLLEQGLTPDSQPATLRIAVNADSLATWLLPALTAQELLYDLVIDDQDHAQDWLKRGQVSAAITAHPGPAPGCDSLPLGCLRYLATASPGFVARHFPDGPDATSLSRAPALTFNLKDRLQARWVRALTGRSPRLHSHLIPASEGFAQAARLGLGWGMNPEPLIRDDLTSGRLVALGPPLDVALFWQVQRVMAPRLTALTRAIKTKAAAMLRP